MFSEFSRGYYVGRMYVAPRDDGRAALHRDVHERFNEQLYADEAGISRLDAPLVMKLENYHLAVGGDPDVPAGTLEVPEELLEETDVRNPPSHREVLLAKADVAARMLDFASGVDEPAGI